MDKTTKKTIKFFSILEHEKEEKYLREMHKSGWKFVKISKLGFIYYFEKCEPEDVIYQLDYNKDGIEHKDEYVKMFNDCGWEYMMDYVGYSYFRKPASEMTENEETIFCDDSSRLEMLERVYKGRVVPLFFIFFMVIIPQLVLSITIYEEPALVAVYSAALVIYLCLFIGFAKKYKKYKNNLE